nr:unnamed protein product [Callosobruchus analis]
MFKRRGLCIEHYFGRLKQRFSILQYKARLKLKNIPKVLACCIILHSIAKTVRDLDFFVG